MQEKIVNNHPIRTVNFSGLSIGGEDDFYFISGSTPLYALTVNIYNPEDNFQIVDDYYQTHEPHEILHKAQQVPCDIINLKFNISEVSDIPSAVSLLKELSANITKPLMITGVNDNEIDRVLLPELSQNTDREAVIAFADENTYKDIVPSVIDKNHVLVLRTPIDINLAKELNILTTDMGLCPDKILVDTDIGGLGYGLEYGYSIMEKIKLEGFANDCYLNMPLISFAGEESLKTKEAKSDTFSKSWGEYSKRAIMIETASASAASAAGANVIVLNHPQTIITLKGLN